MLARLSSTRMVAGLLPHSLCPALAPFPHDAAPPLLATIQEECGCRPTNAAHLALHLDWSLSTKQGAARLPELVAAARSLRQQMLPGRVAPAAAADKRQQRRRGRLISQLLAPFAPAGQQAAAEAALSLRVGAVVQVPQPPVAAQAAALAPEVAAAGSRQVDASPPAKRAKQVSAGKDATGGGMQYFLQLQGRGVQPAASGGAASSSSSGEGSALEAALRAPTVTAHAVELPEAHAALLRLLREDERRLVRGAPAPGVAPEAARSDFLSVDVLQRALAAAAGGGRLLKPAVEGVRAECGRADVRSPGRTRSDRPRHRPQPTLPAWITHDVQLPPPPSPSRPARPA